jgi:energy-coupling factor transport system permease protein
VGDGSAAAATAYLGSIAIAAFVTSSPIILAGAAAAVVVAGAGAGAGRALRVAARWGAGLGVLLVAVNGVASQRGDTVLVHGIVLPLWGHVDVSAEALAEGGVFALRLAIVMMAFAVHAASVDPDQMFRLMRPVARRSALTATLITRLVPLASADYGRLARTKTLRGPGAAPVGRSAIARRLVAGSLDRAVDVAATLELRGYGRGAPRRPGRAQRSRHDASLFASAGAVAAIAGIAGLAGADAYRSYPTVSIGRPAAALAVSALLPLSAALPFAIAKLRSRAVGKRSRDRG